MTQMATGKAEPLGRLRSIVGRPREKALIPNSDDKKDPARKGAGS